MNRGKQKISLLKNVNLVIYWKLPSAPSWSIPLWPPIQAGKKNKAYLLKNLQDKAITALSGSCYPHLQLTFSKCLRGGRRWGTQVVKGASSPLQWSLCTWKWSWAETSGQGQSRTGLWGSLHRYHLKKKKKIKVRETPRLCFDKLNHEEQFCGSLVAGFVWVWLFLGVCSLACYNIIVLREMSVLEFQWIIRSHKFYSQNTLLWLFDIIWFHTLKEFLIILMSLLSSMIKKKDWTLTHNLKKKKRFVKLLGHLF